MIRFFFFLLLMVPKIYAWNALGHQLIAQIAYDNLNPQTKKISESYLRHLDPLTPELSFVSVASWLDQIRGKDVHWYDSLHYIDIAFSTNESSKLPTVSKINALWAVNQAITVLSSQKSSNGDKALSLAILIHVIGDIHQPLHTANKISKTLPKGDKGGNLFYLDSNPIGDNLHQYWDNGGGLLKRKSKNTTEVCALTSLKKPKDWVKETHQIAITEVYTLQSHKKPSKKYQQKVKNITEQQIFLAGCRLAAILNEVVI